MAEKLIEVGFIGTYRTEVCFQSDLHLLLEDENAYELGEVTNCQTCDEDTRDLEILGSLARCKSCEQKYYNTMERADEYMSAPWNPFDNDYEEAY